MTDVAVKVMVMSWQVFRRLPTARFIILFGLLLSITPLTGSNINWKWWAVLVAGQMLNECLHACMLMYRGVRYRRYLSKRGLPPMIPTDPYRAAPPQCQTCGRSEP